MKRGISKVFKWIFYLVIALIVAVSGLFACGDEGENGENPPIVSEDDQAVIDAFTALVNGLPQDVTFSDYLSNVDKVKKVREEYDKLTVEQKIAVVEHVNSLTKLESKISAFKIATEINGLPAFESVGLDSESAVNSIYTAINGLTTEQKTYITDALAQFDNIYGKIQALKINVEIANLPSLDNVTLSDKATADDVKSRYEKLKPEHQVFVTEFENLLKIESKLSALDIDRRISELPVIEDLTLSDKNAVSEVYNAYTLLTSTEKSMVLKLDELNLKRERISDLESASEVSKKIALLPESANVTVNDGLAISKAKEAYDGLSDNAKIFVTGADKLSACVSAYSTVISEVITPVINLIGELPETGALTYGDKTAVDNAYAKYNELKAEEKAFVTNYLKLKDCVNKISALEVEEAINALPLLDNLTLNDKASVKGAKDKLAELESKNPEAYAMLSDGLESKVASYESKIKVLNVESLISAIPSKISEPTAGEAILDARNAYDALSEDEKAQVTNYSTLENKENEFKSSLSDDVKAVEEKIDLLSDSITLADENAVKEARAEYDKLSEAEKHYVRNASKLLNAEDNIAVLKFRANLQLPSITQVGENYSEYKDIIEGARKDFNRLSPTQQVLAVADDEIITALEVAFVIANINALPKVNEITVSNSVKVQEAKANYDSLKQSAKAQVTNFDALQLLLDRCNALLGNIIVNNEVLYGIVIPENPTDYEVEAGNVLSNFFKEHYGAEITLLKDNEITFDQAEKYFYLGDTVQLSSASVTVPTACASNGYIIKTVGNGLFITNLNGYGSGVITGVYRFLQEFFDMTTYVADQIVCNCPSTVEFKKTDIEVMPEIAAFSQTDDNVNSATHRYMTGMSHYTEFFDTSVPYHNTLRYVPVETYAEEHPKWYSEDKSQICYTAHGDEKELQALIDTVYAVMKKDYDNAKARGKEVVNLTFTQMDNGTFCTCPTCKANSSADRYCGTRRDGQHSLSVAKFCNALSDKFANDGISDVNIFFFAYLQTEVAPKVGEVHLNDNVVPFIAPIYPTNTRDESFIDNGVAEIIEQWLALTDSKKFAVWSYSANYQNYLIPYDAITPLVDNFKYMASKDGLLFWYDEGAGNGETIGSGFTYFRYWLQGKLAVDPTCLDGDKAFEDAVDEFFDFYYGNASDAMQNYFYSYMAKQKELHGSLVPGHYADYTGYAFCDYPNFYNNYVQGVTELSPFFKKDVLEGWRRTLNQAKSAVQDDEVLYNRVLLESVMIELDYLKLYGIDVVKSYDNDVDGLTALNLLKAQLFRDANSCGLSLMRESETAETAFAPLLGANRLLSTVSDFRVLEVEMAAYNDDTPVEIIYEKISQIERLYNNDLKKYIRTSSPRWSDADKAYIENAYVNGMNYASEILYKKVNSLIAKLPTETDGIKMLDGATINEARVMYDKLNESAKSKVVNYDVLELLDTYYNERFEVAYDETHTWFNDASLGTKALNGCDSYRSTGYSEIVEDEVYGKVTKHTINKGSYDEKGNNKVDCNFSAQLSDMSALKKIVKNDATIVSVKFFLLVNNASVIEISTNGNIFDKFTVTNGQWTEIILSREQFLNCSGFIRCAGLHNTTVYVSNLYFIKTVAIKELIEEDLKLLPDNKQDLNMSDGAAIYRIDANFKDLSENMGLQPAIDFLGQEKYDKYQTVSTAYKQRWVMAFDFDNDIGTIRAVKPSDDGYSRVYYAQIITSVSDDKTYGTAVKLDVSRYESGLSQAEIDAGYPVHCQFRFDVEKLKSEFAMHSEFVAVKFFIKSSSSRALYVCGRYPTATSSHTTYYTVNVEPDVWSEVVFSKEEVENYLTGIIRRDWIVPATIEISNFFLIKADEYSTPRIEEINAIGEITAENYLEKYDVVKTARENFNACSTAVQQAVTNIGVLESAEIAIVNFFIADMISANEITVDNFEQSNIEVANVRKEFNALSATQQTQVTNASKITGCENKISLLGVSYVNDLISKLDVNDVKLLDGVVVDKVLKLYETFNEQAKAEIVGFDKIAQVKALFDERWYTVFDGTTPWLKGFDNAQERANLGCDSYRNLISGYEVVSYGEYGDVSKLDFVSDPEQATGSNFSARIDLTKVKDAFNANPQKTGAVFFINICSSDVELSINGNTMRSITTENGGWTKIVLSKEEVFASTGVIRKGWIAGSTVKSVYVSNFYLTNANEDALPFIAQINALNDIDENNYLDRLKEVEKARADYNALSDDVKTHVSNYADLEALEVKIAEYFINDVTALEGISTDNFIAVGEELKAVRKYLNKLSATQQTLIGNINALTARESKVEGLVVPFVNAKIASLPAVGDMTVLDGVTLANIYKVYDSVTDKSLIENFDKAETFKSEYEKKWLVAIENTTAPWLKGFDNAQERADRGCDSYRATVNGSEVVNDGAYGEVTKLAFIEDKNQSTGMNFSAKLDLTAVKQALEANESIYSVIFYLKADTSSFEISVGTDFNGITLTSGEWSKVELSRAEILASTGAIRKGWLAGSTENYIYVSNFFCQLEKILIDKVVGLIADLPTAEQLTTDNYKDYENAIETAKELFESLTDNAKALVENSDKLTAVVEKLGEVKFNPSVFAEPVTALITALPDVDKIKASDYAYIRGARLAYDALETEYLSYVTNYDKLQEIENAFGAKYDVVTVNDMTSALENDSVGAEAQYHHFLPTANATFGSVMKIWNQDAGNMRGLIPYNQDLTGYTIYVMMSAESKATNMYWDYNGTWATSPTIPVGSWVIKEFEGINGSDSTVNISVGINTSTGGPSYIYYIAPVFAVKEKDSAKAQAVMDLISALPAVEELEASDYAYIRGAKLAYEALSPSVQALVTNYEKLTALETAYNAKYEVQIIFDMKTNVFSKSDWGSTLTETISVEANATFGNVFKIVTAKAAHVAEVYTNSIDVSGYDKVFAYVYIGGESNKSVSFPWNVLKITAKAGEWNLLSVNAADFASGTFVIENADGTYYLSPVFAVREKDTLKAQAVMDLISALPAAEDLTGSDYAYIRGAKLAYEALSPSVQALVTNYEKLTALETAYNAKYEVQMIFDMKTNVFSKSDWGSALTETISVEANATFGNVFKVVTAKEATIAESYTTSIDVSGYDNVYAFVYNANSSNRTAYLPYSTASVTAKAGEWCLIAGNASDFTNSSFVIPDANGTYYLSPVFAVKAK